MIGYRGFALAALLALPAFLIASDNEDRVEQSIRRGLDFISRGQEESGTFNSNPAKSFAGIPALCGMAFLAAPLFPSRTARPSCASSTICSRRRVMTAILA